MPQPAALRAPGPAAVPARLREGRPRRLPGQAGRRDMPRPALHVHHRRLPPDGNATTGAGMLPVPVPDHAPAVVRRMAAATALMNVGPMAAVAGAVAFCVAEELVRFTPDCLVENGGDSMLHSSRERVVGLLSDPAGGAVVGLRLKPEDFPLSLCASSSFIGHSFSFGKGDLAVVRSRDAFVADAAATAFCNMLQEPDDAGRVAEYAAGFAQIGVDGVFLQCGGSIGVWGDMELTAL